MPEAGGTAVEAPVTAPRGSGLILLLLAFCSFTVVFNNLIISPVLKAIATDLDVRVSVAGLLITVYAASAGLLAIVAGPLIDRFGRRRMLVFGLGIVTAGTFLSALAPTFATLMACRALIGVGVAALQPTVFSAIGDYFPYPERGRAMGWIISANTVSAVVGIPVGAVLAQAFSWRITFVFLGTLALFACVLTARQFPRLEVRASRALSYRADYSAILRHGPTLALLGAMAFGSVSLFAWTSYMGAFFQDRFGLTTGQVGPLSAVFGIGVLVGSNLGGRLSDRVGKRPIALWAGLFWAPVVLALTGLHLPLAAAIPLVFIGGIPISARFV
ncbi:MAG: MFS transporter, partial [Dehalococcoidia bacterium]|nr:MFS transporter [Dehalococcoidia bacterium]